MMALINGVYDWLMYLREKGDSGFSSRNPEHEGTKDDRKVMDFMLSNGQLDYYPLFYVLPTEQVMKALNYFERNHKLPEFITWHNDAFLREKKDELLESFAKYLIEGRIMILVWNT